MRLSNFIIYASLAIVVSASVGFLIFKTLTGSASSDSQKLSAQIEQLTADNQMLLDESAKAVKKFSQQITSLNDDLRRASKLVTEKDLEITRLKTSLKSESAAGAEWLNQLSLRLSCQPDQVESVVNELVTQHQELKRKFELVNSQLASQMTKSVPDPSGAGVEKENQGEHPVDQPKIKKLELSAPENQWALGGQNNSNDAQAKEVQPEAGEKKQPESVENRSETVEAKPASTTEAAENVQQLVSRIETLESELRNREKLLFEQTSLIENLKNKSRIETGFRSVQNVSGSTPSNLPFKDRGTFKSK